jgi:hypothetical protein
MSTAIKWILAAALIGASATATAQVTYFYAGSKFDIVSGPYTTSDSVQGSFTVPSALPPGLCGSCTEVMVSTYSFSDGVQTLNGAGGIGEISTNDSGQIGAWYIDIGPWILSSEDQTRLPDAPAVYDLVRLGDGSRVSSGHAGVWTGPIPTLVALRMQVTGVGPGKSLANKVDLAQAYYAAKDAPATCAMLKAFINEVEAQTGKKIVQALGAQLVAEAQGVEAAIGCNAPAP